MGQKSITKLSKEEKKKGGIVHQDNADTTVMETENVMNKTFSHKL